MAKRGYGRKKLASEVDSLHFRLPKFEKIEFENICTKRGISPSSQLQLLVARFIYENRTKTRENKKA